jgi:hypothetical protein
MKIFGKRVAGIALALAATLAVGGCYDDGYGYSGVSVGYGSGGYYGDPWYGGYPSYGWYDGFYYPGRGYWLYDRSGQRHRWNDHHRRYWEGRRHCGGERSGAWQGRVDRRGDGEWRGSRGERRIERDRSVARQVERRERMSNDAAHSWRSERAQRGIEARSHGDGGRDRSWRGERRGRGD